MQLMGIYAIGGTSTCSLYPIQEVSYAPDASVALAADIAGPRQVRLAICGRLIVSCTFQLGCEFLRLLLSLAKAAPACAAASNIRCLRLSAPASPALQIAVDDGASHVLHQMAIHRSASISVSCRRLAMYRYSANSEEGPRKRRLARKPAGTAPAAQPA